MVKLPLENIALEALGVILPYLLMLGCMRYLPLSSSSWPLEYLPSLVYLAARVYFGSVYLAMSYLPVNVRDSALCEGFTKRFFFSHQNLTHFLFI